MIKIKKDDRLTYNSWHFSAVLIFIIGSVISPITTLLSLNIVGTQFLLPDFVTMVVHFVVFTSVFIFLITAIILFIVGCKKSNPNCRIT